MKTRKSATAASVATAAVAVADKPAAAPRALAKSFTDYGLDAFASPAQDGKSMFLVVEGDATVRHAACDAMLAACVANRENVADQTILDFRTLAAVGYVRIWGETEETVNKANATLAARGSLTRFAFCKHSFEECASFASYTLPRVTMLTEFEVARRWAKRSFRDMQFAKPAK